jgi:tight adherence protein B
MRKNLKQLVFFRKNYWDTERFWLVVQVLLVMSMLAYFFYKSIWAFLPMSIPGCLFGKIKLRQINRKKQEKTAEQFKECILSVAASLRAGYAVENAFLESREDMRLLYGEQSDIYQELERIRRGLIINISLEELLNDFAERTKDEDILQFANVFAIAKRTGGNMSKVIQNSAELIGRRIETRLEIQTLLGGRLLEQTLMRWMPFGILCYISVSYPHYLDALYGTPMGIGLMSGCLVLYTGAYYLGERIWAVILTEII